MSLLSKLRKLGDTIPPSELTTSGNRELSALIQVLEHEGLKVAEELFPREAEVAQAAVAAAPAVTAEATKALEALLARVETAVQKVEGKAQGQVDPPPEAPVAVSPVAAEEDPAAVIAALKAEIASLEASGSVPSAPAAPSPPSPPVSEGTSAGPDPDAPPSPGSADSPSAT